MGVRHSLLEDPAGGTARGGRCCGGEASEAATTGEGEAPVVLACEEPLVPGEKARGRRGRLQTAAISSTSAPSAAPAGPRLRVQDFTSSESKRSESKRPARDEKTGLVLRVPEPEAQAAQETQGSARAPTPDAAGEACADAPEGGAPTNPLLQLTNMRLALSKFRRGMEASKQPDFMEEARGVQVQRVYDFYDVATRRLRVRKMFGDVLHHRRPSGGGRNLEEPPHEAEPSVRSEPSLSSDDEWCASEPSVRSNRSISTRTPSDSGHDGGGMGRMSSINSTTSLTRGDKRHDKKRRTITNQEKVTSWGIIVGKLLHKQSGDAAEAFVDIDCVRRKLSCGRVSKAPIIMHGIQDIARTAVREAEALAKAAKEAKADILDCNWDWASPALLAQLFGDEYRDVLFLLATSATKLVAAQPVLAEVEAPARVFGDIHGQLRDLLLLWAVFGLPSSKDTPVMVFNGDFVDRGCHQVAVLGVLLALKVTMPQKVWLIRGNHEDRSMNEKYGFWDECLNVLGEKCASKVFSAFQQVFDNLPVACLISERVLVLHGGIGDGAWKLSDLRSIRRPLGSKELNDPVNRWIFNLLWSDPIEEDDMHREGVFGAHPSPRGQGSVYFAWDLTKTFCARNGLGLIVRSHQSKQDSLGFDVMHDNMLIRVFSARDYEEHANDGAVLLVTRRAGEDGILSVRPQVLRSVTKALDQEILRRVSGAGASSQREDLARLRASRRREVIFRPERKNRRIELSDEAPDAAAFKAVLWKLKEQGGNRRREEDWYRRDMWISKDGNLAYLSDKEKKALVYFTSEDLSRSRIVKVSSNQACKPWSFLVLVEPADGGRESRTYFAAESEALRHRWLSELGRLSNRAQ